MIQAVCPVVSRETVGPEIHVLKFHSPELCSTVKPGQFVNIKISDSFYPLLRRPFSVYHVHHETAEVIFSVVGIGTEILAAKRVGDMVDLIGPLGSSFTLEGHYETAILVAGGLGVASLPLLTQSIRGKRSIASFLGARSKDHLIPTHLENLFVATDDGSAGYHGTVVDLLRDELGKKRFTRPKIFACGPVGMLDSVNGIARDLDVPCEISLESAMACGFGICQGCPIERSDHQKKYSLVCKEGPVFDSRSVRLRK